MGNKRKRFGCSKRIKIKTLAYAREIKKRVSEARRTAGEETLVSEARRTAEEETLVSEARRTAEEETNTFEVPIIVKLEPTLEELEEEERRLQKEITRRKLHLVNVDIVGNLESRTLRVRPEPIPVPVREKQPTKRKSELLESHSAGSSKRSNHDHTATGSESSVSSNDLNGLITVGTNVEYGLIDDIPDENRLVIDETYVEDTSGTCLKDSVGMDWNDGEDNQGLRVKGKRGRPRKALQNDGEKNQGVRVKGKRGRPRKALQNDGGEENQNEEEKKLAMNIVQVARAQIRRMKEKLSKRNQCNAMIARVYQYLKREYEFMKTHVENSCDLSPLANILKRTAEATGVSTRTVSAILETEEIRQQKLRDKAELHLQGHLRRQRKKEREKIKAQREKETKKMKNKSTKIITSSDMSKQNSNSAVTCDNNSASTSEITCVNNPVIETLKVEVFDDEYNDPFGDEIKSAVFHLTQDSKETDITHSELAPEPVVVVQLDDSLSFSAPECIPPNIKLKPVEINQLVYKYKTSDATDDHDIEIQPILPGIEETELTLPGVKLTETTLPEMEETELTLRGIDETGPILPEMEENELTLPGIEETEPTLPGMAITKTPLPEKDETERTLSGIEDTEPPLLTIKEEMPITDANRDLLEKYLHETSPADQQFQGLLDETQPFT